MERFRRKRYRKVIFEGKGSEGRTSEGNIVTYGTPDTRPEQVNEEIVLTANTESKVRRSKHYRKIK